MLSYEKFLKLVPEETAAFVNYALPYLNYYAADTRYLDFKKTNDSTSNYYNKFFFLMLYAMTKNPTYESYFSKYGFNRDRNEPPRCRADGVSQGVTTSSIIGYSPIHNLDFLHIPRLLLRLYSYPLLQQNSRLSKIPRPIIFL